MVKKIKSLALLVTGVLALAFLYLNPLKGPSPEALPVTAKDLQQTYQLQKVVGPGGTTELPAKINNTNFDVNFKIKQNEIEVTSLCKDFETNQEASSIFRFAVQLDKQGYLITPQTYEKKGDWVCDIKLPSGYYQFEKVKGLLRIKSSPQTYFELAPMNAGF